MAQQNRLGGYLLAIVSALAFGAMPVLAVGAYEGGAGVAMLLFWRFMLAALVLGPAALLLARRRAERPGARAIGTGLVMGGVLYAGQAALYFVSVQQGSAALAALLQQGRQTRTAALAEANRPVPSEGAAWAPALQANVGAQVSSLVQMTSSQGPLLAIATDKVIHVLTPEGQPVRRGRSGKACRVIAGSH